MPTVHWKEIPANPSDASFALQRLSEQTVSCRKLGTSQVVKICEGGDEIVLTGASIGAGGVGWWAYRRLSPHECFPNEESILCAEKFCENPRNIGIWQRTSVTQGPTYSVPPTTIAVMSSHAVMTKILDITSSSSLHPSKMCITVSQALSGKVFMLNETMAITAAGSPLARKLYDLAIRGAYAIPCIVIVKLLWDGRIIHKEQVAKTRLKDLLKAWNSSGSSSPTEPCIKRRRITGKSACDGSPSGIQAHHTLSPLEIFLES